MSYPCYCKGCNNGTHRNGRTCRACGGHGYIMDGTWSEPCWEGHYSGDLPPARSRRASSSSFRQVATPLPICEETAQERDERIKKEAHDEEVRRIGREAADAEFRQRSAALEAQRQALMARSQANQSRSAHEIAEVLEGSWLVKLFVPSAIPNAPPSFNLDISGQVLDVQEVKLERRAVRKWKYEVQSRISPLIGKGSWRALNGSRIDVEGVIYGAIPGGPFQARFTFDVINRNQLLATPDVGPFMTWTRITG